MKPVEATFSRIPLLLKIFYALSAAGARGDEVSGTHWRCDQVRCEGEGGLREYSPARNDLR